MIWKRFENIDFSNLLIRVQQFHFFFLKFCLLMIPSSKTNDTREERNGTILGLGKDEYQVSKNIEGWVGLMWVRAA